jgi:hypothetical protein
MISLKNYKNYVRRYTSRVIKFVDVMKSLISRNQ